MANLPTVPGIGYLSREEVLIECTNSCICGVLWKCPWNRYRKPLREK